MPLEFKERITESIIPEYALENLFRPNSPGRDCELGRAYISFIQHNSSTMPHSGNARFLCFAEAN